MIKKITNYFFTGVVISLPIGVTVFVFAFLIRSIGSPVSQLLFVPLFSVFDRSFPDSGLGKMLLDAFSTFIVFVLITALGALSSFFFAKFFIGAAESLLGRIPGVGLVYKTVKQIVDTFSKQNKAVFQYVVMLEFPLEGTYAVGFVTSSAKGEIQERTGETVANVFVPTTPNPTSGFLIMVPENRLTRLDMSVGEAMKLIISGGAVVPHWTGGASSRGAGDA